MKKISSFVMGVLAVITLTQCKKGDTENLVVAMLLPKISFGLDANITVEKFSLADGQTDQTDQTWIDLNANFKKDEGEELIEGKTYSPIAKTVHILGYVKSLQVSTGSKNLNEVTISNRYVEDISVGAFAEIKKLNIINAQSLTRLFGNFHRISEISMYKIENLQQIGVFVGEGAVLSDAQKQGFIEALPDRKSKEKGEIFVLDGNAFFSKEQQNKLKEKNWSVSS